MQTARGNPVTDADGTRQATVLIPLGTTANMVLPNGSTQPISALHVRATEFTVGDTGPEAMPAPLPPSSGYTYAVELSADEAIAADATTINFNQPLPIYVENFLGFPVGSAVPLGYYDREKGQWIASDNGRVIKVLGITGGMADLDIDGDGVADTGAPLAGLGVTDDERARLASLYAPGQSLSRMPVTHFTPWDGNYPYGPPLDAIPVPDPRHVPPVDDPCITWGSVIGCESQSLGESVPSTAHRGACTIKACARPVAQDAFTVDVLASGAGPAASEPASDSRGGHDRGSSTTSNRSAPHPTFAPP